MNHFKTVFFASRPSFLILSLSIVILAASIAEHDGAEVSVSLFIVTLLGAVLSHAAVNLLNEYQDHLSGLDFITQKTPFSGGSGSLQQNPQAAKNVLNTVKIILGVLVLIGVYFVYTIGWQLLPLGILGIALIVFYTSNITRYPLLCLISPGLAFGPVMLLSCYFVFTGQFSILAFVLSFIPFFLVNNLLLLNQVPDLEADKKIGRFNILMKIGITPSMNIFTGFELMAFGILVFSIEYFQLPKSVWLGGLTFVLVIPMVRIVLTQSQQMDKLMPALTMNVIINLLTPMLIGLGLWLAIV
ncbi:hypothetical protein JCM30760_12860 [Thiomicrorhabdus hydrogeniphila]